MDRFASRGVIESSRFVVVAIVGMGVAVTFPVHGAIVHFPGIDIVREEVREPVGKCVPVVVFVHVDGKRELLELVRAGCLVSSFHGLFPMPASSLKQGLQ